MARSTPTRLHKFQFLFFILLSLFFLYLDINNKSFDRLKVFYKTSSISISTFFKDAVKKPFLYIYDFSRSKDKLLREKNELRDLLNQSQLSNFFLINNSNFYIYEDLHKEFLEKNDINALFIFTRLVNFDANAYFCCDKHRLFIKPLDKGIDTPILSPVFNSSGLIGQTINYKNHVSEVIILSDTSHSLPVKIENNNFYCNAKGSGNPGVIICEYNNLDWNQELSINQKIYTSGLGGIYPEGIYVGFIEDIITESDEQFKLRIRLISDPLDKNIFGVIR